MQVLFIANQSFSQPSQYARVGTLTPKQCFSWLCSPHQDGHEAKIRNRYRNGNTQSNGNQFCKTRGKKVGGICRCKIHAQEQKAWSIRWYSEQQKGGMENIFNKIRVYTAEAFCIVDKTKIYFLVFIKAGYSLDNFSNLISNLLKKKSVF